MPRNCSPAPQDVSSNSRNVQLLPGQHMLVKKREIRTQAALGLDHNRAALGGILCYVLGNKGIFT